MYSILKEISKIRNGAPIIIDYSNSNRYRIVLQEYDGSKSAYYFNTPIYNQINRKLIDVKFHSYGDVINAVGSNAAITITENILMENNEGSCGIELMQKPKFITEQEIHSGNNILIPTTNGIAIKCDLKNNGKKDFIIEVDQPFLNIRANDKYFALMKENFRPFVVFSCIGSLDSSGNVVAPAKLEYQKLTDKKYSLTVSATNPLARYVLIEGNLYENKLFQDTTVESMNPTTNNAFGSVGFIGNTSMYGEQWLYSKLDYSKLSEIMDKIIYKVVLHMPKFNDSKVEISAYKVAARFCSFGSNWDNKIAGGAPISDSSSNNGYQSLDFTSLIVDKRTKTITKSDGMILKSKIKGSGFSVIATGDSYLSPQIMEVNFR